MCLVRLKLLKVRIYENNLKIHNVIYKPVHGQTKLELLNTDKSKC